MNIMSAPALTVLGLVLLSLLLWFARVRSRRARPAPALIPAAGADSMLSVPAAAKAAYDTAKRERLVIATVAENARDAADPVAWFARSIVGVVPVYRASEAGGFERLDAGTGVGMEPQSLYILERNYPAYMSWARTMQ
jgi:hypothetical protein